MFDIKTTKKTDNVEFASRGFGSRSSRYQKIFDALAKMKIGQTMVLSVDAENEKDRKKAVNNISQAVYQKHNRVAKSDAIGVGTCRLAVRTTVDGDIAISKEEPLSEEELAARKRGPRKGSKKKLKEAPAEKVEEPEEEYEEEEYEEEEEEEEEIDL